MRRPMYSFDARVVFLLAYGFWYGFCAMVVARASLWKCSFARVRQEDLRAAQYAFRHSLLQ